MKRRVEAATVQFTDVVGRQKNKGRSCQLGSDSGRPVVSLSNKPTGVGPSNTRAGYVFNASGSADASKLARSLSLRCPAKARHGADDERPSIRQTGPDHQRPN
jgi:hypothetical protein